MVKYLRLSLLTWISVNFYHTRFFSPRAAQKHEARLTRMLKSLSLYFPPTRDISLFRFESFESSSRTHADYEHPYLMCGYHPTKSSWEKIMIHIGDTAVCLVLRKYTFFFR